MNSKKVTIQDIARTANVSKSTVSRVLNNSTPVNEEKKQAVLEAMEKLNFKPNIFARGLAGGQSMTIGVVTQNIGSPFYDQVTQGIVESLSHTQYSPLIADGQWMPEAERIAIQTLVGRQVDGLIIVGGTLSAAELSEVTGGKPTVVTARELDSDVIPSVFTDNLKAGYDATKHLIDCGHRQIAHITGIKTHQDAIRRYKGYVQALENAEIPLDTDLVFEGNFSGQSGVLAIEAFLTRGCTFTAVFAANDEMAYGARLALYRKGIRVPEDVSIIGFDNQPLSAYVTPPLTTIQQPASAMSAQATRLLLNQIKDEPLDHQTIRAELIQRESVARFR